MNVQQKSVLWRQKVEQTRERKIEIEEERQKALDSLFRIQQLSSLSSLCGCSSFISFTLFLLGIGSPLQALLWWRGAASWFHYGDSVDGRVQYCDSANRILVLLSEGLPRPATHIINSPTKMETRVEAENEEASSPLPPPNYSLIRTESLCTPGKTIIPKESYSLAFPFISVTVARLGFNTKWAMLLSFAYMSSQLQRKCPDWNGNS